MTLISKGKNIDTAPIRRLFVQGEKRASSITFIIDSCCGGIDLSDCVFTVRGLNRNGEFAESYLTADELPDGKIALEWLPDSKFTAVDGELSLELRAYRATPEYGDDTGLMLKYIMPPITVRKSPNGTNCALPDSITQSLEAVSNAVASGIAAIGGGIAIKAVTAAEYEASPHEENILYVITEE